MARYDQLLGIIHKLPSTVLESAIRFHYVIRHADANGVGFKAIGFGIPYSETSCRIQSRITGLPVNYFLYNYFYFLDNAFYNAKIPHSTYECE